MEEIFSKGALKYVVYENPGKELKKLIFMLEKNYLKIFKEIFKNWERRKKNEKIG